MGHRDRLTMDTEGGALVGPWTDFIMPGSAVRCTAAFHLMITYSHFQTMLACPAGGLALVGLGDGRPTETDGGALVGPWTDIS